MQERVHYLVRSKNPHHGAAIAKGFGARAVPAEERRLEPGALHIIGGLQHGSLELMQQVLLSGEPYIFIDRAYFGGGPGSNRLRVVPGAYQHHWLERWPDDRLRALGVEIQPWRKEGRHILVVPPGAAIAALFGLGPLFDFMPERLAIAAKRPVYVSRKGDPAPLADRLRDCHCVVTWTSNVAVEALAVGVPVFCAQWSAAAPMALMLDQIEHRIETPARPQGREVWAAALAYGQFTVDEIAAGYAAEIVLPHFRTGR